MAIKCNDRFVKNFVTDAEINALVPALEKAHDMIVNKSGEGNDFLGWHSLPVDYDKEEFERIKKAAKKIQDTCDVLIVIGIGGSYLGARAAIDISNPPTTIS